MLDKILYGVSLSFLHHPTISIASQLCLPRESPQLLSKSINKKRQNFKCVAKTSDCFKRIIFISNGHCFATSTVLFLFSCQRFESTKDIPVSGLPQSGTLRRHMLYLIHFLVVGVI